MINAGGESSELFAKEIREIIAEVPKYKIVKKTVINLAQYNAG